MIILIVMLFLPIVLSTPAWIYLYKRAKVYWWEYGLHIYGYVFWALLVALGVGPQSLSNLIELVFIGGVAVVLNYLRAFVLRRFVKTDKACALVAFIIMLCFVLGLRLFMPLIPE